MQQCEVVGEPSSVRPEEAARRLRGRTGLVWLDSALQFGRYSRWSIVASDPRWTMVARGFKVTTVRGDRRRTVVANPIAAFAEAVEREQRAASAPPPELPFAGGAIGYLGFELARAIERLPATTLDDVGAPDLAAGWYDAALVWDHDRGEGWLAGTPDAVAALRRRLRTPACEAAGGGVSSRLHDVCSNLSRRKYLAAVAAARGYIERGDIYQVNLAQRFSAPLPAPPFDLYLRLREVSPSPFAAYLALGGIEVLSSSPERLLLADGDELETRPIKGTRPRGATPAEDELLARELLASAKDHAEHIMIVDLERNDLGRVARVGSVRVPQLAALESFAQVHHLTSTVAATRRPDANLERLLRAILPGGSVTGAPKIRALEIIDELEPTVRGVYTGAIGYISSHGRTDLNVAIRTVTAAGGHAHVHVGGAIVHDSDPASEYQETLDKARGMACALGWRLPGDARQLAAAPPLHA